MDCEQRLILKQLFVCPTKYSLKNKYLIDKWNISILPAHLLPLGAAFGALKMAVSPITKQIR